MKTTVSGKEFSTVTNFGGSSRRRLSMDMRMRRVR